MKIRRLERGYTVVEVLSAMMLFAIGAAGVISMQRVTIQGGDDARRMDVATNIAHEWTFRLQRDSTLWTLPDSVNTTTSNLATDTAWIKKVTTDPDTWQNPDQAAGFAGWSGAFDLYGRDRPTDSGDHMFCAQYRLAWIVPEGSPILKPGALVRAEVRVFWARLDQPAITKCDDTTVTSRPDPDAANAPVYYHFVYATTAVRPNPSQ